MTGIAVASRRMQFQAGPQTHTFYACAEHAAALEKGDVTCFMGLKSAPLQPVHEDEDIPCDFCREGGGE